MPPAQWPMRVTRSTECWSDVSQAACDSAGAGPLHDRNIALSVMDRGHRGRRRRTVGPREPSASVTIRWRAEVGAADHRRARCRTPGLSGDPSHVARRANGPRNDSRSSPKCPGRMADSALVPQPAAVTLPSLSERHVRRPHTPQSTLDGNGDPRGPWENLRRLPATRGADPRGTAVSVNCQGCAQPA